MQGVPKVLQPGSPSLPRPGSGLFGEKIVQKHGGDLVPSADIAPTPTRIVQQSATDQKAPLDIVSSVRQRKDIPGNPSAMILILDAHSVEHGLLGRIQMFTDERAIGRRNPRPQRSDELFDPFSHSGLLLAFYSMLLQP